MRQSRTLCRPPFWTGTIRQGSILAMGNESKSQPEMKANALFIDALRDLRRTWPQLLVTDALARVLTVVLLTPLVGLLLRLFLGTTKTGVLSDQEILGFAVHPIGFLSLILIGACSLTALFIESGALMVLGFGAHEDRGLTSFNALVYVWRRAPQLVRLAAHALVRLAVVVIPFLAGFGAVYFVLLARHDINYYLRERPPSLWLAVVLCGLLGLVLALLLLRMIAGWIVALPIVLFEDGPPSRALSASRQAMADWQWPVTIWLTIWIAAVTLISIVLTAGVGFLGRLLIPEFGSNLIHVAVGMGVVLGVSGAGNLAVSVITTMVFALLVARLYRRVSDSGELQPRMASAGSLGGRAVIPVRSVLFLCGCVLVIGLVVGGAMLLTWSPDEPRRIEIIAHRGASGVAPENTMAAFEEAIRNGADWIEIDVQENAEGTVVVQHDSDFMRAAGVALKVWDATADDLGEIDVGSWFDPHFAYQRAPTLSEVLELAAGKIGVVIELKYYGHEEELEMRVVDAVEAADMAAEISIMSLKYQGVERARALRPEWTYGLLSTVSAGDLTRLGLNYFALNSSAATRSMIQHAHSRGVDVYVWTVNDPIQMSVMISRGADGIITDEPARARRVMGLREELGPFAQLLVWIGGETGLLQVTDTVSGVDDA